MNKSESKELAVYQNFDGVQNAAAALYESGFFTDVKSKAQAIVKVMAGAELGLPPFASMSGIHIVQGKPVLGSNVIATLVKNDPRYDYHIKQADDKACVIVWIENGNTVGESSFVIEEAQRAGLTGKDNWKKWTSDMLFARSISRGARRYAPGIFGGSPVYTPDEMNMDIDEDGYIIEAEIVEEPQPKKAERPQAPAVKADPLPAWVNEIESSDGELYISLPTEKLSFMMNSIQKALASDIDENKRNEAEKKAEAIELILAARRNA